MVILLVVVEAEMVYGDVVVSLHWLAMMFECCVDGDGLYVRWLVSAYACVRW